MQGRAWNEPNLPRASGSSDLRCRATILYQLVVCTQRLKVNISNHFVSVIWGSFVGFQKIRTASRPLWVPGSGEKGKGEGGWEWKMTRESRNLTSFHSKAVRKTGGGMERSKRGTASGYPKPVGIDALTTPGWDLPFLLARPSGYSFGTCNLGDYPRGEELPRDWTDHSDSQDGNSPSATEPGLWKRRRP